MVLRAVVIFCVLGASLAGEAQLDFDHFPLAHSWHVLQGNHRFSDRWGLHTEGQYRFMARAGEDLHTGFARVGADYRPHERLMLTAGYAFFVQKTGINPNLHEHRLWQQVLLSDRLGRVHIRHRARLEQRWAQEYVPFDYSSPWDLVMIEQMVRPVEYHLSHRLRYMPFIIVPLNKPDLKRGAISVQLQNEIFLKLWQGRSRLLSQNRTMALAGYHLADNTAVQLGYLMQTLFGTSGGFEHVAVLMLTHNIDFRAGAGQKGLLQ